MTDLSRKAELDEFKTQIDLRAFMSSDGFSMCRKKSSRGSSLMRHTCGDKLLVSRRPNGAWTYFNVLDDRDRGTIIDYVKQRRRLNLGEIRKLLRPWVGKSAEIQSDRRTQFEERSPVAKDLAAVRQRWDAARPITGSHSYLNGERSIPAAILESPLFRDHIRTDPRGNAFFAHWNLDGLSAFEIKNRGFTSMSPGGTKGLFISLPQPHDVELVVCETAIDVLSYAALYGTDRKRFASTAGHVSGAQRKLLRLGAEALPAGGTVTLAFDNDEGGRRLADAVEAELHQVADNKLTIQRHFPPSEGSDWNDVLRQQAGLKRDDPSFE